MQSAATRSRRSHQGEQNLGMGSKLFDDSTALMQAAATSRAQWTVNFPRPTLTSSTVMELQGPGKVERRPDGACQTTDSDSKFHRTVCLT